MSAPPQPFVEFGVIWYLYLIIPKAPTVETHAWHGTLNPFVAVAAGRNASYGSQRPVVWFAVARGQ